MDGKNKRAMDEKKGCDDKNQWCTKGEGHILGIFQRIKFNTWTRKNSKIVDESRKRFKTQDEAFSKDGFDKTKYVQIMNEKRDNMLKSQTEVIEKSYAILTPKQKRTIKSFNGIKKRKMKQRIKIGFKGWILIKIAMIEDDLELALF